MYPKIKEKKKKINTNIDLAILPSYDKVTQSQGTSELEKNSMEFSIDCSILYTRFSSGPLAYLEPSTNSVLLSLC